MKKMTVMLSLGLTLGSTAFAGGAGAPATKMPAAMPACMTITDLVGNDPQFSTLLTAVQAAGLEDTLKGGSYTVFAPTNAAFAKVPSDALSSLLNDPAMLKAVLLYHVVPGKVSAKQVMSLKSAKTANGATVAVRVNGSKVMINGATVIKADVMACNGIVHVIDTVLMPPAAAAPVMAPEPAAAEPAPAAAPAAEAPAAAPAAPDFNVSMIPITPQPRTTPVGDTTSADTMAPDTMAPDTMATDTAATTDTSTTTDTATTTDATMTDTSATTDTTTVAVTTNTIYDVISTDERFSTLAGFLSDAGLDETLMGGQYTIFAPTNDAFAKLDDNTLAVLASDHELLKQILLYHVVSGNVPASTVITSTQLASAEGSSLTVAVSGSDVTVDNAKVLATDIAADNGVIHAIDTVLVPTDVTIPAAVVVPADTSTTVAVTPAGDMSGGIVATNMTIADVVNNDARFTVLKGLLTTSGLITTLGGAGPFTAFLPTDSAFAKVPATTLSQLTASPDDLIRLLGYHVATGAFTLSSAVATGLTSVGTEALPLPVIASGTSYTVGGSTVLYSDIKATNGYINVVDSVIVPPAKK